jgi:hypothetical protein
MTEQDERLLPPGDDGELGDQGAGPADDDEQPETGGEG